MDQDRANRVLAEAVNRSPAAFPHGYFFCYDHAPGADGGRFCWFRSRHELLGFIQDYQLYLGPGRPEADPVAIRDLLGFALHFMRAGKFSESEALVEINRSLEGFSQVHWLGGYGDLLKGEAEFPKNLRIWFRSSVLGEPVSPLPIPNQKEQAFLEALRDFRLSHPA